MPIAPLSIREMFLRAKFTTFNEHDYRRCLTAYQERIMSEYKNSGMDHTADSRIQFTSRAEALLRTEAQCGVSRAYLPHDTTVRISMFDGGGQSGFGVYAFPSDLWPRVRAARSRDISEGLIDYQNECAYPDSGGVRFFVDLDFRGRLPATNQDLLWLSEAIVATVRTFFPSLPIDSPCFTAILATSSPRPKPETSRLIYAGAHLIFPEITVDLNSAHEITMAIRTLFDKDLPGVVDDCYRTITSLRPVYSRKPVTCPFCLDIGDRRRACSVCRNTGKVSGPSHYTPFATCRPTGDAAFAWDRVPDLSQESPERILSFLNLTTIVPTSCYDYTVGFHLPMDHIAYSKLSVTSNTTRAGKIGRTDLATSMSKPEISRSGLTSVHSRNRQLPSIDITEVKLLEQFKLAIRQYHPNYNTETLRIVVQGCPQYARVQIKSNPERKFCQITGDVSNSTTKARGHYHRSNSIYFLFNLKTFTYGQRCFDSECTRILRESDPFAMDKPISDMAMIDALTSYMQYSYPKR